jgi:hypothetical protein
MPGSFILVPCPQEGRSIRCQGHLEADAALALAGCPRVARLQEQPLLIWYAWRPSPNGCQIRLLAEPPAPGQPNTRSCRISYIVPDFLVGMRDGRQRLLEVKPSRKLNHPAVRRQLAVAQRFAERGGWAFHLLTEQELRRGPLLANLRLLRRYHHLPADAGLLEQLTLQVQATGTRLGEVLRPRGLVGAALDLYPQVLHMLSVGRISFDPGACPLGPQTLLFPKGTIPWDPFASAWAPNGCSTGGPIAWCANPPPNSSSPST